jgi:hypothetical protein
MVEEILLAHFVSMSMIAKVWLARCSAATVVPVSLA